jgi:hypothetical protein
MQNSIAVVLAIAFLSGILWAAKPFLKPVQYLPPDCRGGQSGQKQKAQGGKR